jgi:general L-amino acid transport system substrate-binding protein
MSVVRKVCTLCLLAISAAVLHASGPTVDAIRKVGVLTCGIDQSEAEFSTNEEHGSRVAFDSDLCKAVATAILGPHPRIAVKGYPDSDTALQGLRNNEVDLVATVSDDFSHSTMQGVRFTQSILLDGNAFLVLRSSGLSNVADLNNKKICFLAETEAEIDVRSWFDHHKVTLIAFPFQEEGEMEAAFVTGNCAALSGDMTRLANARTAFGSRAKDYRFLPEMISADPLASAFRSDDNEFGKIVGWTESVLLSAEEMHITSKNIGAQNANEDPLVKRLLGTTHELGRPLGLRDDWTSQVIAGVGNYGEIFDRDLGSGSPLKMPRGQNRLWTDGGLLQPLPLK